MDLFTNDTRSRIDVEKLKQRIMSKSAREREDQLRANQDKMVKLQTKKPQYKKYLSNSSQSLRHLLRKKVPDVEEGSASQKKTGSTTADEKISCNKTSQAHLLAKKKTDELGRSGSLRDKSGDRSKSEGLERSPAGSSSREKRKAQYPQQHDITARKSATRRGRRSSRASDKNHTTPLHGGGGLMTERITSTDVRHKQRTSITGSSVAARMHPISGRNEISVQDENFAPREDLTLIEKEALKRAEIIPNIGWLINANNVEVDTKCIINIPKNMYQEECSPCSYSSASESRDPQVEASCSEDRIAGIAAHTSKEDTKAETSDGGDKIAQRSVRQQQEMLDRYRSTPKKRNNKGPRKKANEQEIISKDLADYKSYIQPKQLRNRTGGPLLTMLQGRMSEWKRKHLNAGQYSSRAEAKSKKRNLVASETHAEDPAHVMSEQSMSIRSNTAWAVAELQSQNKLDMIRQSLQDGVSKG